MAIPLALAASETGKKKYLTAVHTFQKFREDHPRDLVILVIISQQRIPSSLQEGEAFPADDLVHAITPAGPSEFSLPGMLHRLRIAEQDRQRV
jgi:hypothetical protein